MGSRPAVVGILGPLRLPQVRCRSAIYVFIEMRISYIQYPVNKYRQEAHALYLRQRGRTFAATAVSRKQANGTWKALIDNRLGPVTVKTEQPAWFSLTTG